MLKWLKRKSTEKDNIQEVVEFDKSTWEAFVKFTNKGIGDINSNRVYVKYNYIGVDYSYLIYKYIVKDGKILGVNLFVHEHPKSTLSCNLINRVLNVTDAIEYVNSLSSGVL